MTSWPNTGIDWTSVKAVIFDIDGTLFDHIALRWHIRASLLRHLLTRRSGWRDVRTLHLFRRERERLALAEAENIGRRQFEEVAAKLGLSDCEVESIVARWIYQEPLAFVARHAMPDVARFIQLLQAHRIRTGAFSDYPADDKLCALGITIEVVRDAADPEIGRLKPAPNGFIHVAKILRVSPQHCMIIGDRDDRDGVAARRGGFMYLKKIPARCRPGAHEFSRYAELIQELDRAFFQSHVPEASGQ